MPITTGALALGSTIIGSGGGDTSDLEDLINDYAKGRIICDTSTFSVGDTIRVRSMTDSSKVWNQQVVTVGTALVFTVPPYDYYKICTVQTIDDTPTEIGGVYKTVDYGQTLFVNVLDKSTLGGIQGILNAHQEAELLAIGDEVTIKVNNADWVMQIAGINLYDTHEVILVSKNIYNTNAFHTSNDNIAYVNATLRANVQSFYNIINENDRQYIKIMTRDCVTKAAKGGQYSDYVWVPSLTEVTNWNVSGGLTRIQFPLFVTQANRVKSYNLTPTYWWVTDNASTDNRYANGITTAGISSDEYKTTILGVVPCFHLTADS